jgi:hypothetical protein
VYADASWKRKKIQDFTGLVTGIGVFLLYKADNQDFNIMVQASTSLTASVLQAEAKVLLLAAKLSDLLQVDMPAFLTDNQTLARTTASKRIDHTFMHWDSRHIFADFSTLHLDHRLRCFTLDETLMVLPTIVLVRYLLRHDLRQPICCCVCSAYAICPAILILQNSVWTL